MPAVTRIVSGGQTGADREALDWAIAHGLDHEGWCPRGRLAEDGAIDGRYRLQETPDSRPIVRTRWNVRDSDATVIFSLAPALNGGSLRTLEIAGDLGKPVLHLSRDTTTDPAAALAEFLREHAVRVLNVAGPRASGEPEVGAFVRTTLEAALGRAGGGV